MGRPDLIEGNISAAALAAMAFDTWGNKLRHLPDNLAIFPAHGGGSLCGLQLSNEPTSTLGTEKKSNNYLEKQTRGEFIAALLEDRPEVPQNFSHIAALNKRGPQLVDWEKPPAQAGISRALMDPRQSYVVDLRSAQDYAAGHILNAVNIGLKGELETWVGTLVPWNANLVLCGNPAELAEATTRLQRVGYPARVITPEAWEKTRIPLVKSELIKPEDLKIRLQENDSPMVVDVRPRRVWAIRHPGKVLNLPLSQLSSLAPEQLDPAQPVVTVCDSTYGASLAVGILERLGFKRLGSLDGGSDAWIEAGLNVTGVEAPAAKPMAAPAPAYVPKRVVRLPQRISAADLKRTLVDLPGTFDLVDIRPPQAFADYNLPGSVNVDVVEVMQNPIYLKGTGPLILVDRDGSLAMAVGGVLSQKTWRPIKVLHGGLEAYVKDLGLKPLGQAPSSPETPGKAPTAPEAGGRGPGG
jgi:rhodanese-related sulfurtransferase